MEKKNIYENLLCTACLCVDKKLQSINDSKLIQYYMDILNELPVSICFY